MNSLPCIYRGKQVGTVQCDDCAGRVFIKVYRCEKFGSCTIEKKLGELADCGTCLHHDPVPKGIAAELEPPFEAPPISVIQPNTLELDSFESLLNATIGLAASLSITFRSLLESEQILAWLTANGFDKRVIRECEPHDPLYLERGHILATRE
jgi:hypothetical protein